MNLKGCQILQLLLAGHMDGDQGGLSTTVPSAPLNKAKDA